MVVCDWSRVAGEGHRVNFRTCELSASAGLEGSDLKCSVLAAGPFRTVRTEVYSCRK